MGGLATVVVFCRDWGPVLDLVPTPIRPYRNAISPRYDQEAMYFHTAVREAKRAELEEGLLEVLVVPFDAQMRHLTVREMAEFDRSFRLGLGEGRAGGFSACARECEVDALRRFDGGLRDAVVPGASQLDGGSVFGPSGERKGVGLSGDPQTNIRNKPNPRPLTPNHPLQQRLLLCLQVPPPAASCSTRSPSTSTRPSTAASRRRSRRPTSTSRRS